MPAVQLRSDWDAARVRAAVREAQDGAQVRRLLALAAVYEGKKRSEAARAGAMDRQTLRDWVQRFNQEGAAGLIDRKAPGAACRLSAEQEAELAALIEAGSDRERDGVVRWRYVDLQQQILARWNVAYHESTVGKLIRRLGLRHISARPRDLPGPGEHHRPHPRLSPGKALPRCNTAAMALHLAEISRTVTPGAHAVVLLDQAGWHLSDKLDIPANITLLPLPPKSPELNPVENVWQFMRDNWLSNRVFRSYDDILQHCCFAWNKLVDQPWTIMSIGLRDWAHRF